ncbi:MAG: hypothetical protein V1901_04275 [Patescibacteria group bacterium]
MENKREKGKKLEYIVADYLSLIDKYARPTKASGASTESGDVINRHFLIECKNWNKKNIIIKSEIWNKLLSELPINTTRIPILIQKNNQDNIMVSLNIKDFFEIVYKAYKGE